MPAFPPRPSLAGGKLVEAYRKQGIRGEPILLEPILWPFKVMHGKQTSDFSSPESLSLSTLADVLDRRAREFPDRTAFVYEAETGVAEQWTYRQLQRHSQKIAVWLRARSVPGDRALLIYPPGLDFIAGFFGCLYAGILPVPATYPKPRRPLPRADAIARDCQPKLVLTHSSVLAGLKLEEQSPALAGLAWEATDTLHSAPTAEFVPLEIAGDDLAFLQYTSGSISEPRGVMISHQNVLHNLESIRVGFQIATPEEGTEAGADALIGVFWLPAYHDMGLIGCILMPIYVGATSYLLAPTTFLRRPLRWLEVMSETQAGFSGSPNFGYDLAIQKSTAAQRESLNLQNWRLAFCGAEPINPDTLQDFAKAFGPAGFRSNAFYPCYGMAEVTLLVTGGEGPAELAVLHIDRSQLRAHRAVPVQPLHPQAQALVSCGSSLDGQILRIVEPETCQALADGHVGEIWVRGGSVARGYWNQDCHSQETFQATLATGGGPEGAPEVGVREPEEFLRTGDLGFFWEGKLFVTGRLKDMIIVRGRNYYPQDIERSAQQAHPAVGAGVACSIPGTRQEQLLVVHEVRREFRKADLDEVVRAIRTAIVSEHELEPGHIVLIRPVSLPITTSGKVQRNRCRGQFLAGELAVLADWHLPDARQSGEEEAGDARPAEAHQVTPLFLEKLLRITLAELSAEVETWLIGWLTVRAHLNPGAMLPDTPFAELGIDSLTAVEISQDLDSALGLQLPPMVIWSCPTAEALSVYLAEQLLAEKASGSAGPNMGQIVPAPSPTD